MATLNIVESATTPLASRSRSQALTANRIQDIDLTGASAIPDSTTNQLLNVAWVRAQLAGIYIVSDQVVTIKSNSSGSPDDTLVLAANVPVHWYPARYHTKPFATADVTKLYVTNASGQPANITGYVADDATP